MYIFILFIGLLGVSPSVGKSVFKTSKIKVKALNDNVNRKSWCLKHGISNIYCTAKIFAFPNSSFVSRVFERRLYFRLNKIQQYSTRLKRSAWLPSVSLEWGQWNNSDRSLSAKPGEEYYTDEALGIRNFWRIRISWKPSNIIFHPDELKILREKEKIRLREDSYYEKLWNLYYKWCKNLIFFNTNPSFFTMFRLEKIENTLNRYTSGEFSTLIKKVLK